VGVKAGGASAVVPGSLVRPGDVGPVARRRWFLRFAAVSALGMVFRPADIVQARTRVKARVVVVGGGFGGSTCALHLRRLDPSIEVTLIDPDARYVTCPMSNSVLTGSRDLASITVSRRGLRQMGVNYVPDRVSEIDPQQRRVRLGGGRYLGYDRLVVAPGIRFLWGTPVGYDEVAARKMPHAWIAGIQTEVLGSQLRHMRDGGVVVISVPAGPMRCPPGPFERASLIAAYLKQHKPRSKVLIFDANNHFPRQDDFADAWQRLYPGMIQWIPVVEDGTVVRVDPAKMTVFTAQQAHVADVINIIPPQAPALIAQQAGLASGRGWCPVNPQTFESGLVADVHVIGDACIADPMPKSGSAANAQGRQCAISIVAALGGRDPPEAQLESVCYSLLGQEMGLSIHGHFRAAAAVIRQIPGPIDPSPPSAGEAKNAAMWYRNIVADSFG
jgi:sulfide dehydrogenase [flavocytochrome c] flavoprotein chain